MLASPEYCLKVSNKYLFGESETIRLEDIQPRIQAIIPNRDIVLVTHDGNSDLRFAKELGISIEAICTIDTQMVAQHPLQLTHKASLRELLIILNCPFQHIHVAGNDANFTLRALLMLATRNPDILNLSEEQLAAISTFQAVAQFPHVCIIYPHHDVLHVLRTVCPLEANMSFSLRVFLAFAVALLSIPFAQSAAVNPACKNVNTSAAILLLLSRQFLKAALEFCSTFIHIPAVTKTIAISYSAATIRTS